MPLLLIVVWFFLAIIVILLCQLAEQQEQHIRCWEELQNVKAHRDLLLRSQASEEVLNPDVDVAEAARAGKDE